MFCRIMDFSLSLLLHLKIKNMRIVVLDGYSVNPGDLSWNALGEFGELTVYDRTDACDVVNRAQGADVILTNKVVISDGIMERLAGLKYIGVLATGYNVVDVEAAARRGIVVTNVPAYSTDSVVQMTFAHILNMTNRVAHYACENRKGKWSAAADFCYWDAPLDELAGMTLGVVGLGNIGFKVACIAHSFGMDVFACTSKNSADLPSGIQKTTFRGLLGISDILTLHCPLTADTHEMINKETLGMMKRGALLVNTGRGALVNEADVAEALVGGQLGGYGADVMQQEPPAADNPLLHVPNAYITPHIAWATLAARKRLMAVAAANVKAFANGRPVNIVSR